MMTADLPAHDLIDYGIKLLEEERSRVARDLHDGPAQALTNVSTRLEIIQQFFRTNPEMAIAELERVNRRLAAVINELQRLISDLRPAGIEEKGLPAAVMDLCSRARHEWNLKVDIEIADGFVWRLSPAKQVALYRLLQEVFNNIHEHAEASAVRVQMFEQDGNLVMVVQDDGRGFNPQEVPPGHYGIAAMRERAEFLGGHFVLESRAGGGSKVVVTIPLEPGTASAAR